MILKDYQQQTLDLLRDYLEACRLQGPAAAYDHIINQPEQKTRLGRYAGKYIPLKGVPDSPKVCLRLPTGGGKTILAARSIAVARDAWIERDFPIVLWLVPSSAIRTQTVEALKNPRHPYRQQLDEGFGGRVRVFDIGDFTQIRPHDLQNNLCVVVGTIQTLRVSNTEGRKVYAHNEYMESHFSKVSPTQPGLETLPDSDRIKFSFANLLHLMRPIMVVDEAHNAVTGLSEEMQQRVNPSCILEFTATPRLKSNILHSVTAQELKNEQMIKMPVVLSAHQHWQAAVDGAIQRRQDLANKAAMDKDYIRPIVLFQAQKKDQDVTVEVLKTYLTETAGIAEDKIAIATGSQRELDGVDLFDPACPVEFVITVEALKEGWDCSFAYVFCSVARIQSAQSVEQLLGRVLRMPYARRRDDPALNRSYAHLSDPDTMDAARGLRDKLVDMGFDEQEAADNIEQDNPDQSELGLEGGLFAPTPPPPPVIKQEVQDVPDLSDLPEEDQRAVTVEPRPEGGYIASVSGYASDAVYDRVANHVSDAAQEGYRHAVTKHRQQVQETLSPAARRVPFVMPGLVSYIQGEIEFADFETFDAYNDWSLLDYPLRFEPGEFSLTEDSTSVEIDLDGNRLTIGHASAAEQLALDIEVDSWTERSLALALDKLISDIRFSQGERMAFCLGHVEHLVREANIPLPALWRAKFVLGRKLKAKIAQMKQDQAGKAYQQFLFEPAVKTELSFDYGFTFHNHMYDGQKPYRGKYSFKKHYLDPVPAFDGQEEEDCAFQIDGLPEVKHWLRNVSRHPGSFRLPLAQGWTYPDFVVELTDGRLMVVEYKGDHLVADSNEKRMIGELWERHSNGKGLYIMVTKQDDHGRDMRKQLVDKMG